VSAMQVKSSFQISKAPEGRSLGALDFFFSTVLSI
jgi:hypothetical protein